MRAGSGTHRLHGRPHRVQKDQFCLWWHWSTFSPTCNITPCALCTNVPEGPLCSHFDCSRLTWQPLRTSTSFGKKTGSTYPIYFYPSCPTWAYSCLIINLPEKSQWVGFGFSSTDVPAPSAPQAVPSLLPRACSLCVRVHRSSAGWYWTPNTCILVASPHNDGAR